MYIQLSLQKYSNVSHGRTIRILFNEQSES